MGTRLLQSSEQFRCQPQIADTPKKFAHLSYARQLSIAFLKISTFVSKHFLNAKSCAPTALRYELGVALEHLLAEDGPVTLDAAYAQLPTITSVGMATLPKSCNRPAMPQDRVCASSRPSCLDSATIMAQTATECM